MPSRSSYVLRINGKLFNNETTPDNKPAIDKFREIFEPPSKPPMNDAKLGWPDGLVREGFKICQWGEDSTRVENYGPHDTFTLLDFRTEIFAVRRGQLYTNRDTMLPDVEWFYHYPDQLWHKQLKERLENFNDDHVDRLAEKLWFRDWQWYCGNGGDGV